MKRNSVGVLGDEEEVGGFVKTRRTRKEPDERPGKNKTPRHQGVLRLEEAQAPAVALSVVSAEKPPEKKEEVKEMKDNKVPVVTAATRPEFEICPLCGFFNKSVKTAESGERIRYLVCKGDDDRYLAYAKKVAGELAEGKKPEVLSKIEWVLRHLDIELFERELEDARKKRDTAATRIDEKVRIAAGGKDMPREFFIELRTKFHQEVSREDYFLVRRLNARLQAARKLKPELEQMLAEKKAAKTAQTTALATVPAAQEPLPAAV